MPMVHMNWLREYGKRIGGLSARCRRDANLEDEFAAHLESQ
jgi:hypothetical protein